LLIGEDCRKRSHNDRHITTEGLEPLCHLTVKHAKDPSLTFDKAHFLYEKFIKWIDEIMLEDQDWQKFRGSQS
jgi:hypothetical protein